jgi:hypothetical protein
VCIAAGAVVAFLGLQPASASTRIVSGVWFLHEGSGLIVHDSSGYGNNGTLGGSTTSNLNDPSWITAPWRGYALHYNGSDFVTVPDSPSLDSAQITVAALVRATGSPGSYRYVAAKGAFACESASYGLYTGASGGLEFYVSNGPNSFTLSPDAGTGIWDGNWHVVAGTFDGSSVRLYVDGRQVGTGTPSTITPQYGGADNESFVMGDYLGPCPTSLGFVGDIGPMVVLNQVINYSNR